MHFCYFFIIIFQKKFVLPLIIDFIDKIYLCNGLIDSSNSSFSIYNWAISLINIQDNLLTSESSLANIKMTFARYSFRLLSDNNNFYFIIK